MQKKNHSCAKRGNKKGQVDGTFIIDLQCLVCCAVPSKTLKGLRNSAEKALATVPISSN